MDEGEEETMVKKIGEAMTDAMGNYILTTDGAAPTLVGQGTDVHPSCWKGDGRHGRQAVHDDG